MGSRDGQTPTPDTMPGPEDPAQCVRLSELAWPTQVLPWQVSALWQCGEMLGTRSLPASPQAGPITRC